jgi:hypothetical protein
LSLVQEPGQRVMLQTQMSKPAATSLPLSER